MSGLAEGSSGARAVLSESISHSPALPAALWRGRERERSEREDPLRNVTRKEIRTAYHKITNLKHHDTLSSTHFDHVTGLIRSSHCSLLSLDQTRREFGSTECKNHIQNDAAMKGHGPRHPQRTFRNFFLSKLLKDSQYIYLVKDSGSSINTPQEVSH